MKSIIATLAAAIMMVAAANVNAQTAQPAQGQAGHQRQTPEQMVQTMKTNLSLTDDQSAKILAIYQDADKQASADGVTREQRMEIMKKAHTDVNAVLTPDQQAKQQSLMAAARGDKGQGGQQGAGDNANKGGKGKGGHKGGKGGGGNEGGGDNSGNAGGGDE